MICWIIGLSLVVVPTVVYFTVRHLEYKRRKEMWNRIYDAHTKSPPYDD